MPLAFRNPSATSSETAESKVIRDIAARTWDSVNAFESDPVIFVSLRDVHYLDEINIVNCIVQWGPGNAAKDLEASLPLDARVYTYRNGNLIRLVMRKGVSLPNVKGFPQGKITEDEWVGLTIPSGPIEAEAAFHNRHQGYVAKSCPEDRVTLPNRVLKEMSDTRDFGINLTNIRRDGTIVGWGKDGTIILSTSLRNKTWIERLK